jgi:transposase
VFVRKKKNKSGLVSVQVIDKSNGKYKLVRTIGSSHDDTIVNELIEGGQRWIKAQKGQYDIDFVGEEILIDRFVQSIEKLTLSGTDLLIGRIFDEVGYNQIKDELFRLLVIYRVVFPVSKLKMTEYLYRYHQKEVNEDQIYRYLDKLVKHQKTKIEKISYLHTLKVLGCKPSILFYDVTTIYFEIDLEDELRKTGFSKEGKHQHPQIVLGLLVGANGYPMSYEIFEGNKFEGHTMLTVVEAFRKKYELNDIVIIADSGLLSTQNITELQEKGYSYILGARIKNENKQIKEQILQMKLKNGESKLLIKDEQTKLIVNYSEARAKKDKRNREKGMQKLKRMVASGNLTKSNINNRGYNKYLKIENEIKVSIDEKKFELDKAWDGLKGYLTNTSLPIEEIIENYKQLWNIEKAFRISKTDLKIRPIFHYKKDRINAHICITFAAYKIYKELERQLKVKGSLLSAEKSIEIAKTIFTIKVKTTNNQVVSRILILNEEQKYLAKLFNFNI